VFADEAVSFALRGDDKAVCDLSDDDYTRLNFFLSRESKKLNEHTPCYTVLRTPEGQFKDFCFTEIHHFGTLMVTKQCESACELLDEFYSQRDRLERIKQKAQDLFRLLVSLSERTARRTANQRQELAECADRDSLKIKGDLIMTNLYTIKKGMTSLRCVNFYSENGEEIEITLDPRLTPSQNAQKYYKEYKKADTAEKKLAELIEQGEEELRYIDSVFDSLTRADSETDIAQLREELAEQGYIKKRSLKSKATKSLPPIKFRSTDGYTILVGRHNRQNDRLTLKDSQKTDIWLHTQGITGSHTVICCNGETPPDSTIEQAARIAAYHSKGQNSSQVPVDYTLIKYVKKPNGAKPGMVIFTNQRTLYVKPDSEEIAKLKQ
jgi:predicted ribosome quality control (RQC) complex YloA/Tae2 family protein